MTSADRTSSLARLQPLTTYCDDECAHERRSQARRQSIKGGCSPSDPASFTTNNRTFERTNTSKIIERTYPHTNCSTPWERNPRVVPVYLLTSERSIIRQHSSPSSAHSRTHQAHYPLTCQASDNDVVCGPLPPSRGPDLQEPRASTI